MITKMELVLISVKACLWKRRFMMKEIISELFETKIQKMI